MKSFIVAFTFIIMFFGAVISCTDKNNNGNPDNRDDHDKDTYGHSSEDTRSSQGSENYPGNSEGTNTDNKRYGAETELDGDTAVLINETNK